LPGVALMKCLEGLSDGHHQMPITPWTTKELAELKRLALRFKMTDLCNLLGRSYGSIKHGLSIIGFKSPFNKTGNRRIFYAENVACIFELKEQGFSFKEISKCFNVEADTIKNTYNRAKRCGFDAYPKRSLF